MKLVLPYKDPSPDPLWIHCVPGKKVYGLTDGFISNPLDLGWG